MRFILIYLDTHAVVWLYAGEISKFSTSGKNLINQHELIISPIVKLELQYLYEINRISKKPNTIINDLHKRIGLKVCKKPFKDITEKSLNLNWTRDPFDRIIVANAEIDNSILLTKDESILKKYKHARW